MISGEYFTTWDGTGEAGEKLPEGVYFCVLRTNTSRLYMKTLLLQ